MKYQPFRDRAEAVRQATRTLRELLVPFVPECEQVAAELAAWQAPTPQERDHDQRAHDRLVRLLAACEEVLA